MSAEQSPDIGWISAGEWVKYTVNIQSSGYYTFQARIASPDNTITKSIRFEAGATPTGFLVRDSPATRLARFWNRSWPRETATDHLTSLEADSLHPLYVLVCRSQANQGPVVAVFAENRYTPT